MPRNFGAPLYIIAGFPAPLSQAIISSLKKGDKLKQGLYVQAASRKSGPLYQEASTNALLRETWAEIRRYEENGLKRIEPSRLVLLYVPDPSARILLDAFGFSCFPIPIQVESEQRHLLRRNPNFATQTLKHLVKHIPKENILMLEREISGRMRKTLLLLPPKNFIDPNNHQPLKQWFLDVINDPLELQVVSQRLTLTPLTNEDVSRLKGGRGRAFVDNRNLCFLPADVHQEHGRLRTLEKELPPETIRHWLNGKFRFGIPINGEGFHYDVQKVGKGDLKGVQFECEIQGAVQTENTHINIYPNDFVRR